MPALALLACTLSLGCPKSSSDGSAPSATTAASAAAAPKVVIGSKIVAALSTSVFLEGVVTKVAADKVTFAHGRADDSGARPVKAVAPERAFLIGTTGKVAAGQHGICRAVVRPGQRAALPAWHACRIVSSSDGTSAVVNELGDSANLPLADIVLPPKNLRDEIAVFVKRQDEYRRFDKAFLAAGRPASPSRWRAKKGEEVVAHFVGTSWYGATIVDAKVGKDKVRIDWDGDTWDDRDIAIDQVAPQPSGKAEAAVGQFALLRPSAAGQRWQHVEVRSVGPEGVKVVDRSAAERTVKNADLLLFKKAP